MGRRKSGVTPLGIIAAFVTLSETIGGLAATLTTGSIQVAFTSFAVGFPLLVGIAFFAILWRRSYVLYPPQDFGPEVDVKDYVDAMRQQAMDRNEVLSLIRGSIAEAFDSDEAQAAISRVALTPQGEAEATLHAASRAIAERAVGRLQDAVVTIDISPLSKWGDAPQLLFPYDPEEDAFSFLSAVFFQISDSVAPFTYGKDWVLQDAQSQLILMPEGVDWRDRHALVKSKATVRELGVVAGMQLLTIPLFRDSFRPATNNRPTDHGRS